MPARRPGKKPARMAGAGKEEQVLGGEAVMFGRAGGAGDEEDGEVVEVAELAGDADGADVLLGLVEAVLGRELELVPGRAVLELTTGGASSF